MRVCVCKCFVATIYYKCAYAHKMQQQQQQQQGAGITGIKVMCDSVLGATTMLTKPPLRRRFWHTNLNLKQSNAMKKHKPN